MQVRPEDLEAMRLALVEARAADGDIPIGAVIMDQDGNLLAGDRNRREQTQDPTAHAEILVLRRAAELRGSWRLMGCTLAVTMEPCPMCAGAAALARVDRVVFGAWNEEYGACGSQWDILRDRRLSHRPEVVAGVLAAECGSLVQEFMSARRLQEGSWQG